MSKWKSVRIDKDLLIETETEKGALLNLNDGSKCWVSKKLITRKSFIIAFHENLYGEYGVRVDKQEVIDGYYYSRREGCWVEAEYANVFIYLEEMTFKTFKSKKNQTTNKFEKYDEKTLTGDELIEKFKPVEAFLNLFIPEYRNCGITIFDNLITYINTNGDYVKLYLKKREINIYDSSININFLRSDYLVTIQKDYDNETKSTLTSKELYEDIKKATNRYINNRYLSPSPLDIPKDIVVNEKLKDDDNYAQTGKIDTKTLLYEHQQKAVAKLLPTRYNALFMDMGTGKTRTAIEILKIKQNKYNKVFWITPVSLKYNLFLEFIKHTNLSKDDIYMFNNKTNDTTDIKQNFIIVGLESISSSSRVYLALNKLINKNDYIVIDESNFIKGNSKRNRRLKEITRDCKYRMILTGTPISQGIVDLYNQFSFLNPRILGYRSFYQFANQHLRYNKKIPYMIVGEYNQDYIAAKISPYTYQIKKDECLDLKDKKYIAKYFYMDYAQKKWYEDTKEEFFENFISYEETSIFTLFQELQQIVSGFIYVNKKAEYITNNRVNFLRDVIFEIDSKAKIIIWAKYTQDIKNIVEMIKKEFTDSKFVVFDGSKNENEKAKALDGFKNNPSIRFFIANQSTGAFGLNLTEATYTIFYNNGFKYSERIQAEDRNHRIGQNKEVTYIDIVCDSSIDERILLNLEVKGNVVNDFKRELNEIKDKKLRKSLLEAVVSGKLDKAEKIKKIAKKSNAAKRMEKMRRKRGVIPREEYIENSISHKAPWKALGISRASWYRKQSS